ncbi:MAG: Sua5/YciO/YrdC/YwlC family protein [Anaerolineales bacterium]
MGWIFQTSRAESPPASSRKHLDLHHPQTADSPSAASATSTAGVRAPDHDVARALLRAAGPMAVTSANISGQPSPSTAEEVFAQLNGRIELIIDGGKTPGGVLPTVVDCISDEIKILRE